MLLDEKYNLKIADFGFAAPIEGKDNSGYLTTKLGTHNYMAPEIHMKEPYQGDSVDLFAASIILFVMVSAHLPFGSAEPNDNFYRCLGANRADLFWRTICKNKQNKEDYFSDEFKDLITSMLQVQPTHRPSITEVMGHPWMQLETPCEEEVFLEFEKRHKQI